MTLSFDARGRITIPRRLREGLGEHVLAVRTPHGVVLHPVPATIELPIDADQADGDDAAVAEV